MGCFFNLGLDWFQYIQSHFLMVSLCHILFRKIAAAFIYSRHAVPINRALSMSAVNKSVAAAVISLFFALTASAGEYSSDLSTIISKLNSMKGEYATALIDIESKIYDLYTDLHASASSLSKIRSNLFGSASLDTPLYLSVSRTNGKLDTLASALGVPGTEIGSYTVLGKLDSIISYLSQPVDLSGVESGISSVDSNIIGVGSNVISRQNSMIDLLRIIATNSFKSSIISNFPSFFITNNIPGVSITNNFTPIFTITNVLPSISITNILPEIVITNIVPVSTNVPSVYLTNLVFDTNVPWLTNLVYSIVSHGVLEPWDFLSALESTDLPDMEGFAWDYSPYRNLVGLGLPLSSYSLYSHMEDYIDRYNGLGFNHDMVWDDFVAGIEEAQSYQQYWMKEDSPASMSPSMYQEMKYGTLDIWKILSKTLTNVNENSSSDYLVSGIVEQGNNTHSVIDSALDSAVEHFTLHPGSYEFETNSVPDLSQVEDSSYQRYMTNVETDSNNYDNIDINSLLQNTVNVPDSLLSASDDGDMILHLDFSFGSMDGAIPHSADINFALPSNASKVLDWVYRYLFWLIKIALSIYFANRIWNILLGALGATVQAELAYQAKIDEI